MNWITIKLMQYQLKKVQKQFDKETHDIVKKAIGHMLDNYRNAIMFLESNSKYS
jgi:hypothetical protein